MTTWLFSSVCNGCHSTRPLYWAYRLGKGEQKPKKYLRNNKRKLKHCDIRDFACLLTAKISIDGKKTLTVPLSPTCVCPSTLRKRKWQTLCAIKIPFDYCAGFFIIQWSVTISIQFPVVNEIALFVIFLFALLCIFQPLPSLLSWCKRVFSLYVWLQQENCNFCRIKNTWNNANFLLLVYYFAV